MCRQPIRGRAPGRARPGRTYGGNVSNGQSAGLAASIDPSVNVVVAPAPGLSVGGDAAVLPSISTTLKPGIITTIPFSITALAGAHGSIITDHAQIKIDSCMGPVSPRPSAISRWSNMRQVGQLANPFNSADPTTDESFAV